MNEKVTDFLLRIPWTTVIGIAMGVVTCLIVREGLYTMYEYDRDYYGFVKDFISISLIIESLVFGLFVAYNPVKKMELWDDAKIIYILAAMAIPFSIFFCVLALIEAWMETTQGSLMVSTCFATLFAYSSIYALTLKLARKAIIEATSTNRLLTYVLSIKSGRRYAPSWGLR